MSEITHGSESVMSVCADGSVREALFITALSSSYYCFYKLHSTMNYITATAPGVMWKELITSHVL